MSAPKAPPYLNPELVDLAHHANDRSDPHPHGAPTMADYRRYLDRIPESMHAEVIAWIERAEPHPAHLGSFLRAVLTNDLVGAFTTADEQNAAAMHGWVTFLVNGVPLAAVGNEETLLAWYRSHHPVAALAAAPEAS